MIYGLATIGLWGLSAVYFDGLPEQRTSTSRLICNTGALVALAFAFAGTLIWSSGGS